MDRPHSYSSLSTLAGCCEKYRLSYEERLEEPGVNLPMEAGSALDAALNVLYVDEWRLEPAIEALRASWGDTSPPLGAKHSWLTRDFLEERVRLYMEEREESPTILEEGSVLAPFSGELHTFEWHGPEGVVRIRGIPDFVLEHGGKRWVVDLKCTTQWINSYWMTQFKIGHQLRVYAAMLQQLEGIHVVGGLINAVYMGKKALDENAAWKRRKSTPSKLERIDFTQEQVDEAYLWAKGLEEVEEGCRETGRWPRNEHECTMWGSCEFLPLCTAPSESARKALMMTRYVRKERR